METAPRTDTSHEARARNAKAMALATVLHQHKASTALLSVLASHAHLAGPFWSMTAFLATEAHLMGTKPNGDPVTVHVPHSQATIDAVARILGDLIAHANDQAALAADYVDDGDGPFPTSAERQAEVDRWLETGDCRPVHFQTDASHVTCGALMRSHNCPDGWDLGTITLDWLRVTCEGCYAGRPIGVDRRPTDSAGYRTAVTQMDDETARSFAMFANGAGR